MCTSRRTNGHLPVWRGVYCMISQFQRRPLRRAVVASAVLAAAAAGASGLLASSTAKAASKCSTVQTLRTGYNISAGYLPPIIAQANGYLVKYCLQVQEQPIAGAAVLLAQVESGNADMALLNPAGIIQAVEAGIQLRIIAPDDGAGDMPECTAANSGITSITQLTGKAVATTLLRSSTDVAFRVRLARAGVNINSNNVHFVQVPNASIIPEVINGTVQAAG